MSIPSIEEQLNGNNSIKTNLIIFSKYLLQNDLLNVVYEVIEEDNKEPHVILTAIGIPKQIIDMIRMNINKPLEEFNYPVLQIPVLRRVYSERKPIYFKKVPDLVGAFIPTIK